jgi:hypothetical protein
MLKTDFWRNAASSLPPHVRARYAHDFEAAERLDLALESAGRAYRALKAALGRRFAAPPRLTPRVDL